MQTTTSTTNACPAMPSLLAAARARGLFHLPSVVPHKAGWSDTHQRTFTANSLRLGLGQLTDCASCHGAAFDGGTSGKSCLRAMASYPHNAGWIDPASAVSHGKFLKAKSWDTGECARCHGANFSGGNQRKILLHLSPCIPAYGVCVILGTRGYLYTQGYPLAQCKTCHGASYAAAPL